MRTFLPGSRVRRFLGRPIASVATVATVAGMLAIGIGAGSASAAVTNPSIALSNNQAGATSSYTISGTFANATPINWIDIGGVSGIQGTGSTALGNINGLGAGALQPGTTRYIFASTYTPTVGSPFQYEVTNLTNPTTPVSNTVAQSITYVVSGTGGLRTANNNVAVDLGFVAYTISSTNTVLNVVVAKSLSFTNNSLPSYTLLMDPSLPALADVSQVINLSVLTNAVKGYTLSVKDTGLTSPTLADGTTHTIAGATSGLISAFTGGANKFGVSATRTSGSGAVLSSAFDGATNIGGYTTSAVPLITSTAPTGSVADAIALTNRVKIDYGTPAATYTDTITYTATPSY